MSDPHSKGFVEVGRYDAMEGAREAVKCLAQERIEAELFDTTARTRSWGAVGGSASPSWVVLVAENKRHVALQVLGAVTGDPQVVRELTVQARKTLFWLVLGVGLGVAVLVGVAGFEVEQALGLGLVLVAGGGVWIRRSRKEAEKGKG